MDKKQEHYEKVIAILTSCENRFHLKTAVKIINQFNKQYQIGEHDPEYIRLKQMLDLMKVKCGVKSSAYNDGEQLIDEEMSNIGKEFKVQAGLSGEPELQKLKFEQSAEELEKIRSQEIVNKLSDESRIDTKIPTGQQVQGSGKHNSPVVPQGTNTTLKKGNAIVSSYKPLEEDKIKGGLADDKTIKDIAKKHNVKVGDIKKQIDMGIDVEREHTDSDKIAREIAMDHEDEFPRYYDALADMEKDMEEELDYDEVLYIMKDYGWGDGIYLHQDDFEDSHYYDGESTPEEYAKAFDKYMDDLSTGKLEDYLKGEEELDEATSAGSSGAFVGPLSGKKIRRTFHKSNVPVSNAGGMTKPIGKMYSFKKSQLREFNVFSKKEIMNESLDSGALGVYDSPGGWGNNEFMGTKGKKGNAVQRKGNKHKKTYDYDTGSSTFVKIKDKCKKFPYCNQGPDAIELSKTIPEGMEEKKSLKQNILESWDKFVSVAKREGKESVEAVKILKKVLTKEETTDNEIQFLKEQSGDIAKMLGVVAMGVVSTALPIVVEKALNKKGISILPKERSSLLDNDREELIESICKKTGKSKKYVHSLINRYL
jgi:hypothetical protein